MMPSSLDPPALKSSSNAASKPTETEPLNAYRRLANAPTVLVFMAFALAAIVNWNTQRRLANFESEVAAFENDLQDYIAVGLQHGANCFNYAYQDRAVGLVIGSPDLPGATKANLEVVEAAASRVQFSFRPFSTHNQTIALNRMNTVFREANNKLIAQYSDPKLAAIVAAREHSSMMKANENGADMSAEVGPNAPWETHNLVSVLFAVGWRSVLVALIFNVALVIALIVFASCWRFFLNRIRELARAARGLS